MAQGDRDSAAADDLRRDLLGWGMDAAAIEDYIEAAASNAAPPDLLDDCAEYLVAFHRLSPSRPIGFGVGAIPVSEIRAYCELFGIDEVELFFRFMRALDDVYLSHSAKKSKGK